jgi:hypothetical protein
MLLVLLADGFDVMIGSIVIDVPWVVEGDYSLVCECRLMEVFS